VTKRQKRKIIIIAVLVLLVLLLSLYYLYYRSTHRLDLTLEQTTSDNIPAPQFLYSFAGPDGDRLNRPLGVLVDGQRVYVSDALKHKIYIFSQDGRLQSAFGEKQLTTPLYMAKNPVNGNIYVSDRRKRGLFIFSPDGNYLGEFNPKLPKNQLPKFKTGGVQWQPVALAFGPDGTLYVTEILNGHRLLVFNPSGKFVKSVGTAGMVIKADQGPEVFQFPNGVKVRKGLVYVSDSNNRRIQIFDKAGVYQRLLVTAGLPRGFDFLQPFRGQDKNVTDKLVVVDTLAHDATIWSAKGDKIVNFGEQGVLDGQFEYPNDASVATNNKIFITDTSNGRVQVWGWPTATSPIPLPKPSPWWALCLTPLLLLPLLLFFRKKLFFATPEFIDNMLARGEVYQMPHRRRKWIVLQPTYDRFQGICQDGVELSELLEVTEYSASDAAALKDKYELSDEMAVTMAAASRARVVCTEDAEVRRMSKLMELDVVNCDEYLERFASDKAERGTCPEGLNVVLPSAEPPSSPAAPVNAPSAGPVYAIPPEAPEEPPSAPEPQEAPSAEPPVVEAPEPGRADDISPDA
jgi:DNA-binding beta-propeller fold protein YncE